MAGEYKNRRVRGRRGEEERGRRIKKNGEWKERRGENEKVEKTEREGNWKAAFWNVAGLAENFWKELEEWDFITMSETWLEKEWERIKGRLPRGFK